MIQKNNPKSFVGYLLQLENDHALSWITLSLFLLFFYDSLGLPETLSKYLTGIWRVIFIFQFIRFVYISVDAIGSLLIDLASKTEGALDDQLAPFATRTLKVLVIIFGLLFALQNFGINVMSLLAGLGIGGLALALAAQDTAANLFGSITILFDAPFKIGDHVKITDIEGTVAEVGFRSTRIRTFTNTLVTIPNSIVAKEKVENMGERNARRVRQVLGVHYDTAPEKLTQFCEEVKYLLSQEELIVKDNFVVNFINYNASTLDVLVSFHVLTTDTNIEMNISQKIFLEIWKVAKKLQVEFAYPTQSIYLPKT